MDWQRIKQLKDKYYKGLTTIEEEDELRAAFEQVDCPEDLHIDQDIFLALANEDTVDLDIDVKQGISRARAKSWIWPVRVSMAAACLMLFIVFSQHSRSTCPDELVLAKVNNQKICNQEIAEQEARQALQYVAEQINRSTSQINKIK